MKLPRGWTRITEHTIRHGREGGPEVTKLREDDYSAFGRIGTRSVHGGRLWVGRYNSVREACAAAVACPAKKLKGVRG